MASKGFCAQNSVSVCVCLGTFTHTDPHTHAYFTFNVVVEMSVPDHRNERKSDPTEDLLVLDLLFVKHHDPPLDRQTLQPRTECKRIARYGSV